VERRAKCGCHLEKSLCAFVSLRLCVSKKTEAETEAETERERERAAYAEASAAEGKRVAKMDNQ
jgi:hypothetical protein